jgi:hypothetical protein
MAQLLSSRIGNNIVLEALPKGDLAASLSQGDTAVKVKAIRANIW